MGKVNYEFDPRIKFINPYNFIPADWKETKRNSIVGAKGNLSGMMKCRLITKTPIAIPDTEKGVTDEAKHVTYPFMEDPDGKHMIPGSSLRGVIRSVYETVTDSCFVTVDPKQRITKRATMNECGKPGLLEFDDKSQKWILYEAERFLIMMDTSETRYRPFKQRDNKNRHTRSELKGDLEESNSEADKRGYGAKVWFETEDETYYSKKRNKKGEIINVEIGKIVTQLEFSEDKKLKEGYLYIGEVPSKESGCNPSKHFESVFSFKKDTNDQATEDRKMVDTIDERDLEVIRELHRMYNDKTVNRSKGSEKWYEGIIQLIEKKKVVPIWYRKDGENIVLSLASIGRIVFQKKMGTLLGKKKGCEDRNELCPACSLFGMTGNESVGSRVRITDAREIKGKMVQNVTLKELSGPKISYLPFYAKEGDGNDIPSTYDAKDVNIRGRKYYWHSQVNPELSFTKEKTERNSTMDLLENAEFEFCVYFDSIDQKQLDTLKWVLTLGDNSEGSSLCHKIGHGKPLGLGSVKIVIDEVLSRKYDGNKGYSCVVENGEVNVKPKDLQLAHTNEILKILNMESTKNKDFIVRYPYVIPTAGFKDNELASHQWFSKNRIEGSSLPEITNAITMPLYPICPSRNADGNNGNHYGRGNGTQGAGGNHNNRPLKIRGQEYTVTVIKYEPGNKGDLVYVKFQFEDKSTVKIPYSKLNPDSHNRIFKRIEDLPIGSQYVVKYTSTSEANGKKYPEWKVVRKL